MATPLFTQTVIALVWDFDSTLIPGYMQRPLFDHYGLDEAGLWAEANELGARYVAEGGAHRASKVQYLNYILSKSREGHLPGLSNELLRKFGSDQKFFPGMPDLMALLKQNVAERAEYAAHDICLEHYIVSTGLGEIIRGSAVAEHVDGVWGCELAFLNPGTHATGQIALGDTHPVVAYEIDDTSKTRALFEINKGTNKNPEIDLNASIPDDQRRVPFDRMIYIADGPSDVPAYSIVKKHGGKTYAVYDPGSDKSHAQAHDLLEAGRVDAVDAADYRVGEAAEKWLTRTINGIADQIVTRRAATLRARTTPKFIVDPPPKREVSFPVPRQAIPAMVEDLLARAGVREAPVDINRVLEELRVSVSPDPKLQEDAIVVQMTDPELAGPHAYTVFFKPTRSAERLRYTLAHEAAHVVLHGGERNASSARSDDTALRTRERDADRFAAELLMPTKWFREALDEHGPDVATLASVFRVSRAAASRRIGELATTS